LITNSSEEIVDFLKREISLKQVCQKVWYQKIIEQAAQERGITITPSEIQDEADLLRRDNRLEPLDSSH